MLAAWGARTLLAARRSWVSFARVNQVRSEEAPEQIVAEKLRPAERYPRAPVAVSKGPLDFNENHSRFDLLRGVLEGRALLLERANGFGLLRSGAQ